jgi:hypothetical protein
VPRPVVSLTQPSTGAGQKLPGRVRTRRRSTPSAARASRMTLSGARCGSLATFFESSATPARTMQPFSAQTSA